MGNLVVPTATALFSFGAIIFLCLFTSYLRKASSSSTGGTGSPCGACKFLRRKCVVDCIFAPYFNSEEGPSKFAEIHKVFGVNNVSKLLHNVLVDDLCDAVVTTAYEAQAKIKDPAYGCVANIFSLQQLARYPNPEEKDLGDEELLNPGIPRRAKQIAASV
ncbi:LOB domain-containing protein 16-like [Capsicum annuum]|uniref:LOB domain-containing protein 16-like n=1 Tax=Capsicum annuum TaxID=4072 RepID=UPI001FB15764|nr:LOB domain-containing protein 16-like [Capsicum annuum]